MMKNRRQTQDLNASDHVIRRPLYWPVFLLIMFLIALPLCIWDTPPTTRESGLSDIDLINMWFYSIAGVSIWLPATVIVFILLAVHVYMYARFHLVVHEQSFSVTPLLGSTHEVAFSSVEKVTHADGFSKKGFSIDIQYGNKSIHIPYTLDRHGAYKQKGIAVLLKKLEDCNVDIIGN